MSKHVDIDAIGNDEVRAFAESEGAYMIWYAWKETMLKQGRDVSHERMNWIGLPKADEVLDREIAIAVVSRFIEWLDANSERIERGTYSSH